MQAFDNSEFEQYKAEAKEKWGKSDAYKQYVEKTTAHSKDKWEELAGEMDDILAGFAACMKESAASDSSKVQELVKTLQGHISEHYYHCTNEILAGLGQMYTADERFRKNIDKHADGTAGFIRAAIEAYCLK